MHQRIVYALCTISVMLIGLASRKYRDSLLPFLAQYAGDTLWGLTLFFVIGFLFTNRPAKQRWIIALLISLSIEVSQLYHAPWIDSVRRTTLGGLILGFRFLWTDLACYFFGISTGALVDSLLNRKFSREHN